MRLATKLVIRSATFGIVPSITGFFIGQSQEENALERATRSIATCSSAHWTNVQKVSVLEEIVAAAKCSTPFASRASSRSGGP